MKEIDLEFIKTFQERVMDWWSSNARKLPWREQPTPYQVLVSEIMLQQTQVSRVIPKYNEFLKAFPDLISLAKANTKRLLQVWSGLGYNRRALWLREAARELIERNFFPDAPADLRSLKGIGPYTSRSIPIFAFNKDIAAVDTNIRRVFIAEGFATESMSEKDLQGVANQLLLKGRSRDWHNALMDYGSQVLNSRATGIPAASTQPEFKGSTRETRGIIIQRLTNSSSCSTQELASELNFDTSMLEDLESILKQLIDDGLIVRTNDGGYKIAD